MMDVDSAAMAPSPARSLLVSRVTRAHPVVEETGNDGQEQAPGDGFLLLVQLSTENLDFRAMRTRTQRENDHHGQAFYPLHS